MGFPMVESRCYIFIQPELQNENLPPLKYTNAEARFTEIHEFFMEDLKFDKVEECREFTKEQVIAKLKEIQQLADEFEKNKSNGK